jgi:hypothetical protein
MTAKRTHCIKKYIRLAIVYSNKLGNVLRFRNSVDVLTGALGEVLLAAVKSAPAAASTDRHRQAGSKYGTKSLNARLPGCQWQAPQLNTAAIPLLGYFPAGGQELFNPPTASLFQRSTLFAPPLFAQNRVI